MRPPSLKASDFHRALGTRPVARTAHFALHVLPHPAAKAASSKAVSAKADSDLSTQLAGVLDLGVDDGAAVDAASPSKSESESEWVSAWRLGLVLPKKQARRSVTRSLIRHQAREALRRHAPLVRAQGRHGAEVDGWVVRLKAPFDRQCFPSAASAALAAAVRAELDALWAHLLAVRPPSARGRA